MKIERNVDKDTSMEKLRNRMRMENIIIISYQYIIFLILAGLNIFLGRMMFLKKHSEIEYLIFFIILLVLIMVYFVKRIVTNITYFRYIFPIIILLIMDLIVIYANTYYTQSYIYADAFSKKNLSSIDCLYYSITTFTTTGYGDIYPTTDSSKLVAQSEMIIGYFINVFVFSILVTKFIEINKKD